MGRDRQGVSVYPERDLVYSQMIVEFWVDAMRRASNDLRSFNHHFAYDVVTVGELLQIYPSPYQKTNQKINLFMATTRTLVVASWTIIEVLCFVAGNFLANGHEIQFLPTD
ncbi:hypothetical protein OROMI_005273 [Orobanche minor]